MTFKSLLYSKKRQNISASTAQQDAHALLLCKWQRMFGIVSKHPARSLANPPHSFQRLVISRLLTENLLVFLLQYAGLMLATITVRPSPLWFAAGTACAFIFLRGKSVLPGIWLGSLLACYLATHSLLFAFMGACVFSLQTLFILVISHRFISPGLIFYQRFTCLKFILLSGAITAVASGVLSYFALPDAAWLRQYFPDWWLANWNGVLIFACALLTWDAYFPQLREVKSRALLGVIVIFSGWGVLVMGLVLSREPVLISGFALATLPYLILISTRLGWCAAITANFILGLTLGLCAYLDSPLFNTQATLWLPLFLTVEVITALLIASDQQTQDACPVSLPGNKVM